MPPTRYDAEVKRLRAALRGKHGSALVLALRQEMEHLSAAALAADNSSRYVAANARGLALTGFSASELAGLTVMDITPIPKTPEGQRLWQEFISQGGQRGSYQLRRQDGAVVTVRYWAYASVAPGIHLSLLVPVDAAEPA